MQFSALVVAALASLASAQLPSPGQQIRTTVVRVAPNSSFTFSPNNIRVNVGEFVQFQFEAGNHTVTQSTFDQPCQPVAMHNPNITGFHSGFLPAAASAAMGMIPTYTIQVNNTNPIWIYCGQGRHCENGMVMVINEPLNNPNRTLALHRQLATQANTLVPGGLAVGGSGGVPGSTVPGGVDPAGNPVAPGGNVDPAQAGAGMLSPSAIMLLAAAGFALLL